MTPRLRALLTTAVLAATVLAGSPRFAAQVPGNPSQGYTFRTIDVPGRDSASVRGINDAGQMVGGAGVDPGTGWSATAFVSDDGVTFEQRQFPGEPGNGFTGINQSGRIVGTFCCNDERGFWFDRATGTFTDLHFTSNLMGINASGHVVGSAGYSADGATFSPIAYPGASGDTGSLGISDNDVVVGYFVDAGHVHGFRKNGSNFSLIDFPGSTATYAYGVNNAGQIVGDFVGSGGVHHGFTTDGVTYTQIDVPGAASTRAFGINNLGVVVGDYQDAQGVWHGFVATPIAPPPANHAPVAGADSATTLLETAVEIAVLANDTDADGDALTVSSVTQGAHGAVVNNGNGTVTYTPTFAFTGTDSFSYTVGDGHGGTATAVVTVTVTAQTQGGSGQPYVFKTVDAPGATVTTVFAINDAGVMVGRGEPGNALRDGLIVTPSSNGFTFQRFSFPGQPYTDFTGINQSSQVVGTWCCTGGQQGFTFNGSSFTQVSTPGPHTTAGHVNAGGHFVGTVHSTPDRAYLSIDGGVTLTQFDYPGAAGTNPSGINDDDTIVGSFRDAGGVRHGFRHSGATFAPDTFTSFDVTGASATYANGINNSGQIVGEFTRTGDAALHGFITTDGVTFTTIDVPGAVATEVFGINNLGVMVGDYEDVAGVWHGFVATPAVAPPPPVNHAPVASDDSATTAQGTTIDVDVLANDTDADHDAMSVASVTQGSHGATVTITSANAVHYVPSFSFTGTDTFTYTVSDGHGGTATATVTVTVTATPNACVAPPANGLIARWDGDGTIVDSVSGYNGIARGGVSYGPGAHAQAFVFDGTTGSVDVTAPNDNVFYPGNGSFTISAWIKSSNASRTQIIASKYECGGGVCGGDPVYQFYLETGKLNAYLRDLSGHSTSLAGVRVVADGQFHHVAVVRDVTATEARLYVDGTLDAAALLDGGASGSIEDHDGEPDPFIIGAIRPYGSESGRAAFFEGAIDDVAYYNRAISDSDAGILSGIACATPGNRLPTAVADSASTLMDASIDIDVLHNDSDADGDLLTVTSVTQGMHGATVTVTGNTIHYVPAFGFHGTDKFSYTVRDGRGGTAAAIVTVAVNVQLPTDTGVTDLGAPQGGLGYWSIFAAGVNNFGQVVGRINHAILADGGYNSFHSFLYSGGVMVDISDYPTNDNAANAINNAGQIAGQSEPGYFRAWVRNPAGTFSYYYAPLGGYNFGNALAINSSGAVGGVSNTGQYFAGGSFGAIAPAGGGTWTLINGVGADPLVPNAAGPYGVNLSVTGLNDSGAFIGSLNNGHAFLYANGVTDLGTLGGPSSHAYGINASGMIVGDSDTADGYVRAFSYTAAGGMVDLHGAAIYSHALAVSDNGIIVGYGNFPGTAEHAFVYSPSTGMLDLNSLYPGSGWTLQQATAISKDGRYIAGYGVNPDGILRAFRLTLTTRDAFSGNRPPVAVDDSATTVQGTPIDIDVLHNDSDADGNSLSVAGLTAGAHGTVWNNGDGTVKYTPAMVFTGTDAFSYTISDGHGGTAVATVTVTVTPPPFVPLPPGATIVGGPNLVGNPGFEEVLTVKQACGAVPYFGGSWLALTQTNHSFPHVTMTAHGGLFAGEVQTTSNIDCSGGYFYQEVDLRTQSFDLSAWVYPITGRQQISLLFDWDHNTSSAGSADIVIDPTQIRFGAWGTGGVVGPLTYGAWHQVRLLGDAAAGKLHLFVDGVEVGSSLMGPPQTFSGATLLLGQPNRYGYGDSTGAALFGPDDFIYDDVSLSSVEVILSGAGNHSPVAVADTPTTPQGTPVDISVLANDTDVDGNALTVTNVTQSAHGATLSMAGNVVHYVPPFAFTGTDTFSYTISDGHGGTASAAVTVTVTPNTCVVPPTDGLVALWTGDGTMVDRIGNRAGVAQGTVTYGPGVHGQAFVFDGASAVKVPQANDNDLYPGTGSFSLSAWAQSSDTTSLLDQEIASKYEGGYPGIENVSNSFYVISLYDGRAVGALRDTNARVSIVTGTRVLTDGVFHHIVMVRDVAANELQLYVDGVREGTVSLTGGATGAIKDDDGSPDPFTIGAVQHYFANAGLNYQFHGSVADVAYYDRALSDTDVQALRASAAPMCTPVNHTPVVGDDAAVTLQGAATDLYVLANDTDADGDALTVTTVTQGSHGATVTIVGANVVHYVPAQGFSGTDVLSYTASDLRGGVATATVTVTVQAPVVISIGNVTKAEGTGGTTPFAFPVTLSSASALPVTVYYATMPGTATAGDFDYFYANGTLTFAPGETSKTVTVDVIGDSRVEPDETFFVTLSSPTNAMIATSGAYTTALLAQGVQVPDGGAYRPAFNDFLVAEEFTGHIVRVDAATGAVSPFADVTSHGPPGGSDIYLSDLAVNTAGDVFVPAYGHALVHRFDANGTFLGSVATPGGAIAVALDSGDNLYVMVDRTSIYRYAKDAWNVTPTLYASGFSDLAHLRFDAADHLIVDEYTPGTVYRVTPGGTTLASHQLLASGLGHADGLAIDPATQDVFVAMDQTASVWRITAPGVVVPVATLDETPSCCLEAMDFDRAGRLYVTGKHAGRVWTLTPLPIAGVGTILNDDVNAAPVAVADAATILQDAAADIAVLANDTDADGDTLTVTSVTQGAHGVASIAGNNVHYVPASGFSGTDVFTYTIADGRGGTASATVTVTVQPVFTVAVSVTGSGVVTSSHGLGGDQVTCPGTCRANFVSGTSVVLTATPLPGATFLGWIGCPSSTQLTCTLLATASYTVSAKFSTPSLSLTVSGTGQGTVTSVPFGLPSLVCPGNCAADFAYGTSVVLTATPAPGSTFTSWTGCPVVNGLTCTIPSMTNASSVAASFAISTFPVTVVVTGGGVVTSTESRNGATGVPAAIICPGTCSANFASDTVVVLTATPLPGATFLGWTGCPSPTPLTCTLVATAGYTVNANFTPVAISIGNITKAEGNSGTTIFSFPVTLSAPSALPVTVDYATADGTATFTDLDYTRTNGTLTFAPGVVTQTVAVTVNGDVALEADETFTVVLSNPTNATLGTATGIGTIINDDAPPVVNIGTATSVTEGDSGAKSVSFVVTLSTQVGLPVTVSYATADGTATTADNDYTPLSGTVTFNPGQILKILSVNVTGDTKAEADETFTVTLSSPTNATLGNATDTITIQNDDAGATTTTLTATPNPGTGGQPVTLTATVAVVVPGSGTPSGTVTFMDGATTLGSAPIAADGTARIVIANLAVGAHSLTAAYRDANFLQTSQSAAVPVTINLPVIVINVTEAIAVDETNQLLKPTATVLTASPASSAAGQAVTFTATISVPGTGGGTPTGTVTFKDGNVVLATPALTGSIATFVTTSLTVGDHAITATYNGDAQFHDSTGSLTQTVAAGSTTVALTATPNPGVVGQNVALTAKVTVAAPAVGPALGTVTFADGAATLGTVAVASDGTASFILTNPALGTHALTAAYNGTAFFQASQSSVPVTINQYPVVVIKFTEAIAVDETNELSKPTTTVLTASPAAPAAGQTVTFTATISVPGTAGGVPTGTVTFKDGNVVLGTATLTGSIATYATTSLTAGDHAITATYSGDALFHASSGSLTETVTAGTTTVALTATPNPGVVGQNVALAAKVTVAAPAVGPALGTVTFVDGATTIATVPVAPDGTASFVFANPALGTHALTAAYGGTAFFQASRSPVVPVTINQYPVVVINVTEAIAVDDADRFSPSTTTVLTASPASSTVGQPVTFTATISVAGSASGAPTGTVTFRDGGVVLGTAALTGSSATIASSSLAAGTHAITATYNGDAYFQASTGSLTQTVTAGRTTTTIAASTTSSVFGQSVTYTATVAVVAPANGTPTGVVTFWDGSVILGTSAANGSVAAFSTTSLAIGSHVISATYNGDAQFQTSTGSVAQTVAVASTTTALTSSATPSVVGQSVTLTATVSVAAPGSGAPTGTMAFRDGGMNIAGCSAQPVTARVATCVTAALSVGGSPHAITARYGGDTQFLTSTSGALAQTVNQGRTATTITASPAPSTIGQSVTLRATVSPVAPATGAPTGTVTFRDGFATLATTAVNAGVATFATTSLTEGFHSITAIYNADAQFLGSVGSLTHTVTGNTPTGTNVAVTPVDATTGGSPVSLTFSNVTQSGITSVTSSTSGPPPPSGFQIGTPAVYFDISTTALFSGSATVCIDYTGISFKKAATIQLLHYEKGVWVNRTASVNVATHQVCATVTSFSPFVIVEPINRAPVLTNPGDQTAAEGQPVSLQLAASDADGDALTFTVTGLPTGLRATSAGLVSGTPTEQAAGIYPVTVSVSDGELTATQSFKWTVLDMSGRMTGEGHVANSGLEHHFEFKVTERRNGADYGKVEFWVRESETTKKNRKELNRFDAATITSVTFSDDPGFKPGRRAVPTIDSVAFSGAGRWNGKTGYTFDARATDQGEPGVGRDTFGITIRDPRGVVVATVSGTLAAGNIESLRLEGR